MIDGSGTPAAISSSAVATHFSQPSDVADDLLQRAAVFCPGRRCLLAGQPLHFAHQREAARAQDLDKPTASAARHSSLSAMRSSSSSARGPCAGRRCFRYAGVDRERCRHGAHLDGRAIVLDRGDGVFRMTVRPGRRLRHAERLAAVHDDTLGQDAVADIVERGHNRRLSRTRRVERAPENAGDRTLLPPVAPEGDVAEPVQRLERVTVAHRVGRSPASRSRRTIWARW